MRLIVGCLIILACAALFAVPVSAQDRQLGQSHSIEIEVECLDAATEVIRELNGFNLEATVHVQGIIGYNSFRTASFTRRVDGWAFRHVQEVLRGLGKVHFESENAWFLGSQIMDIEARLAALSQEIDRLAVMLAASDSLDIMIAIDLRLSQVTWERNHLIGRRNLLLTQAASPIIHIWLTETPTELPPPVPTGFGRRIADNFMDSWRGTLRAGGNLLVFIVRISMPLVAFSISLAIFMFVVYLWVRQRRALAITTPETDVQPGSSVINEMSDSGGQWETITVIKPADSPESPDVDEKEGAARPEGSVAGGPPAERRGLGQSPIEKEGEQ